MYGSRWGVVVLSGVLVACHGGEPDVATSSVELVARVTTVTDVSILSRGGGNGEVDRTNSALGCWNLTGAGGYQNQPLIKFADLPVPRGARVTGATLRLVFDNWERDLTVRGRYVAAAWNPAAATFGWATRDSGLAWSQPGARGEGSDVIAGPSFALTTWPGQGADVQTIPLDLAVVQRWVDDPATNQGVLLINETPDVVTRVFSSRHARHGPVLEITYVIDAGAGVDAAIIDAAAGDAAAGDAPADAPASGTPTTVTFRDGDGGYAGTRSVSLLSRGGGNGEVDRTGVQLGCWVLTGTGGYQNRPFIKFTDLALPPGARVTAATLTLVFANWERNLTVRGRYLAAAWDPAAATLGWMFRDAGLPWAQPGALGDGADVVAGKSFALTSWPGLGADVKSIPLDLEVVQRWIDDPAANQGIVLINESSGVVTRVFSSRAAASLRPTLSITYVVGGGSGDPDAGIVVDGGSGAPDAGTVVDGGSNGDTTPPTIAMTAPTAGPALTGMVTLGAIASDDVGVAGIQFLVDDLVIGGEQATGTLTIDTTTLANATHRFAARARDAAGNVATAVAVTRAVLNPPGLDARVANPTCRAPARPSPPSTGALALRPLFPNLSTGGGGPFGNQAPIVARRVRMPGGEWLWFVGLRNGRVFQIADVAASSPPARNLIDPMVPDSRDLAIGEEGFLGLAFDPALATDPARAHVYYVRAQYGSVSLWRADVSRDPSGIYVTSGAVQVLSAGAGGHHYGGDVLFGPDGYLYLSIGEDEIGARTRNPGNLRGKILRLDVHAAAPLPGKLYGIPADNPYRLDAGGQPNPACFESGAAQLPDAGHACPEVWARGFRNPFRFSFDRQGGALWVGDVGADHEEIDLVSRDGDHGWSTQEGTTSPGGGITPAVAELPRGGPSCAGNAIIGGFVYRGSALPGLVGAYVTADNGNGTIYVLDQPYGARTLRVGVAASCAQFNPASFTEDEHGELYVVALNPGRGLGVFQLVGSSSGPPTTGGPPALLSATGCVQAGTPAEPIAAAVPYDVAADLWADGLTKRRWMILPDGTTITAAGDGDWSFPIGTVLVKEFSWGGRRIETRLLVRHDDGDWAGYAYVWNAAQTDADLITDAQPVDLGDGGPPWIVPGRADCLACHTTAKGRSLGLETRQLNHAFVYPGGRRANQLVTLASLGLLAAGYADPRAYGSFPHPADATAPIAARARAYLHANCSHCHPAAGANHDLLVDTPLPSMLGCDVAATPPFGAGTLLVAPGNPAQSVLALRMKSTAAATRMPRLGSSRVDGVGTALVDAWIAGLSGCGGP